MIIFDWLSDPANSNAIKASCALIGIPGSIWGGYLLFKKIRGAGLDDGVNRVNRKADRLLLENRLLRQQMVQDRKLLEQVLLKLTPESLTPELIENIEEVAKNSANENEIVDRRVEDYAAQLREKSPIKAPGHTDRLAPADGSDFDPLAELARLIGQTDPFSSQRYVRNPDDLEKDIEGVAKTIAREKYDPVAELARLIGQPDPSKRG
jgi:hypothetical protein